MLDLIRKKQKTALVQVVFWVIIATFIGTIFLVWGKGRSQNDRMTVAARVNGDDITYDEFKSSYDYINNFYRRMYGERFTPEVAKQLNLDRQAINRLVDMKLLIQEADRLGVTVTREELVKAIASIPAFQVDGKFDKQRYTTVLGYQRLKPEEFEAMERQQMLQDKARQAIMASVTVSDDEVAEEYRNANEKINLEFIPFVAESFVSKVILNRKKGEEYFAAHKDDFRVPPQRSLAYVKLAGDSCGDELQLTDDEIARYYNRHLSQYAVKEQVAAAHILVLVDPKADKETVAKKRQLAEEILKKAKNGADFAELAKKYSDDKGSAAKGGYLGYFPHGAMVPAFEKAAFALRAGELSDVVRSRFGFHIIQCKGRIDAGFKELDQVKDQVVAAARKEKCERLLYEKAMDAYNINRKSGDIEAAAKALGAKVEHTPLFANGAPIPGIGGTPALLNKVFSAPVGKLMAPVKVGHDILLWSVAESKYSYIPAYDDVRAKVDEAIIAKRTVELAEEYAKKALEQLKAGKKMADVAPEKNLIGETGLFSRAARFGIPKLGRIDGLLEDAFALTVKKPLADKVYRNGDTFYVVRLKQIKPADPQGLTEEGSEKLRQQVLQRKRSEVLQKRLKELREQADIVYSPSILRSIEGK